MRRLLWTVLVAAVLPLVLAGAGDAAMWLRISTDPASPLVGRPTRVMVLTLANFSSYCADDPRADVRPWSAWNLESPDSLRFELKAFLGDRVLDIPITRRTADPAYWDGEVVFPSAGDWTLRMVYPLWSGGTPDGERCAGARTSVTVRPADRLAATSTEEIPSLAPIASLLALGTLAGLVMLLSASVRPRADPARNANSADRYHARAIVLGGAVPGRTLLGAMRGLLVALVSTVGIAACVAERAGPPATPTVTLTFPSPIPATTPLPPLDLPRIARGQACPTTAMQHLGATGAPADFGHGDLYTVPVTGPVYPIVHGIDRRTGVIPMSAFGASIEPEYASYRWLKVRWIIAPGYTGPAVVRGRQLDGDAPVRFEQPGLLRLEIGPENTASAGTWRYHTARGSISVEGPGCYGIQIDGESWSTRLIFAVSP